MYQNNSKLLYLINNTIVKCCNRKNICSLVINSTVQIAGLRSQIGLPPTTKHHQLPLLGIVGNRLISKPYDKSYKCIHTTKVLTGFWEKEQKSGYQKIIKNVSQKQLILDGLKELKTEIKLWRHEVKEKLMSDPILAYRRGEVDIAWSFSDDKDYEKWIKTADSDHNEGYSSCTFEKSSAGYGLFSGHVESRVPRDGKMKRAGYCNIKSVRPRKSFHRDDFYDWNSYNTLVLKVRGDGRSYLLNIATEGYFDILWDDVYHYILYTRGGPHWQTAKIPFSKFFLSSKGRVQDRQFQIPLSKVTNMGISVAARGGHDGPFNLEIAYIGLEFDPLNREKFAYEMYKMPKYMVAT